MRHLWPLEEGRTFLNHGSFGACPIAILERQTQLRTALESSPVNFMIETYPVLLADTRRRVGNFLGSDPDHLGFVTNATSAVNAVLRSKIWRKGDQVVVTDHIYNACRNVLLHLKKQVELELVVVNVSYPNFDPDRFLQDLEQVLCSETRLALLDHVASPTALLFPLERAARLLAANNVELLVDGAHAPGMLDLNLEHLGSLGVTYYTGNFHKWCCSPKGAAFLWVAAKDQEGLHPQVVSHGYNSPRKRNRFLEEFDWCGTFDPTAWLCVADSVDYLESLYEGGLAQMRSDRHRLLLEGRNILARVLPPQALPSGEHLALMASLRLPGDPSTRLYSTLYHDYGIDCQITTWGGRGYLRVSAAPYNELKDYEKLAEALSEIDQKLGWERAGEEISTRDESR